MNNNFRLISFRPELRTLIQEGKKTQTRRGVGGWLGLCRAPSGEGPAFSVGGRDYRCHYGEVGSILIVREPWAVRRDYDADSPTVFMNGRALEGSGWCPAVAFDPFEGAAGRKRSPLHMPAWAGRIYLRLLEVSYQPITEISWLDAIAEGVPDPRRSDLRIDPHSGTVAQFRRLWEKIHGPESWVDTYAAWALRFELIPEGSSDWQELREEVQAAALAKARASVGLLDV